MDDSSPPSSVTSSNYVIPSTGDHHIPNEDHDLAGNAWVSSTTKGSFQHLYSIKREPEILHSSNIVRDEELDSYQPPPLIQNGSFDGDKGLEDLDEDDVYNNKQRLEFVGRKTNLVNDVKPNRIYLAKAMKSNMTSSVNKVVTLGGKVISSIKSEEGHLSSITRPTLNGIEFPKGSSAILKLPNPLAATSIGPNGTIVVHQPPYSANSTVLRKQSIVPPITIKASIEGAVNASKGNAPKSIICHSKGTSSNPQWLSSNNTIKVRSPNAVVHANPLKKRALDKQPTHFEITTTAVTSSNVSLAEGKSIANKIVSPSLAKKLSGK